MEIIYKTTIFEVLNWFISCGIHKLMLKLGEEKPTDLQSL